MKSFKASELTVKQQYKYIIGSVVPRPIALVTTLAQDGQTVNIAPFSFFSGASDQLPLLTISSLRANGHMKDTVRNILDQKEAVVHIVDITIAEDMNATCTSLPPDQSELSLTNFTLSESKLVAPPQLNEPKIKLESILHQYVPVKNDEQVVITDLLILKVVNFCFAESVLDRSYINTKELNPVARLAGNQYASLDKEFTLIRPK
ncbi:NADH-FMN oxidoreductase RutF, flavin reductase (DIM6/NTAB) family [Amphibacillus marinus]|uniref:NADH-FMN oxidoreductase RutF, flavin reductase (DIM6/NTAB) family n=1 Tax=Amphibacillus marinus TaxID=872970 RepID=A0A1H8L906_9BACI|nr:flavin reductase family protein [Amphibacillus marinus]SEO01581.1 NADH-FMN oxidoreductase RutF, flavin reductase (DIM6/NTAB) family [Amphibacillus marinus]